MCLRDDKKGKKSYESYTIIQTMPDSNILISQREIAIIIKSLKTYIQLQIKNRLIN